jgi:hypothetical protein
MVLDSQFIMEFFNSDKTETKQKNNKKAKRPHPAQRRHTSITIVISETIQTICDHIGKDEAVNLLCKSN